MYRAVGVDAIYVLGASTGWESMCVFYQVNVEVLVSGGKGGGHVPCMESCCVRAYIRLHLLALGTSLSLTLTVVSAAASRCA